MILHKDTTDLILRAFYNVYSTLGYGFLERVYENALTLEMVKLGLEVHRQVPIQVFYDGQVVGEYFADMVVNRCVVVELKAAEGLTEEYEIQLLNYLKATKLEVGLLLNFGKKPQFVRKVFSNQG